MMASLFEGHEVISMEDFCKLSQDEVFSRNSTKKKCRLHDKTLKIYCYWCEAFLCHDCIMIGHRDHKIQVNDVAANQKREDLEENLTLLTRIETELSEDVKNIEKATKEIIDQGDDLASEIESSFMTLQKILDDRKRELLKELKKKVEHKSNALMKQKTGLGEARVGIIRIVNYTKKCVQHCSDIDVVEMHKDLKERIRQNIKSSYTLKASSNPVESANLQVNFNCASPLHSLCKNKATLAEVTNKAGRNMPTTQPRGELLPSQASNVFYPILSNSSRAPARNLLVGDLLQDTLVPVLPALPELSAPPGLPAQDPFGHRIAPTLTPAGQHMY